MTKRNKIIYWVATIWLALGMSVTGIVQIIGVEKETEEMAKLGYEPYFLVMLGIWKVLGVVAILLPKYPVLKEWAYAGFFFAMTGAIVSHLVKQHEPLELFGPSLLLFLTLVSWYFRPAGRKLVSPANA